MGESTVNYSRIMDRDWLGYYFDLISCERVLKETFAWIGFSGVFNMNLTLLLLLLPQSCPHELKPMHTYIR